MSFIKNILVWTFHADNDGIITIKLKRDGFCNKGSGGIVKYTEVPNAGHVVWDYTYITKGLGLADWLFAQKKNNVVTILKYNLGNGYNGLPEAASGALTSTYLHIILASSRSGM